MSVLPLRLFGFPEAYYSSLRCRLFAPVSVFLVPNSWFLFQLRTDLADRKVAAALEEFSDAQEGCRKKKRRRCLRPVLMLTFAAVAFAFLQSRPASQAMVRAVWAEPLPRGLTTRISSRRRR